MHHPRSISTVLRFRLAATLLVGKWLMALVAAGLLLESMLTDSRQMMIAGVSLAGLTVVLGGVQWLVAKGATCPLCRTPALASMRCTKHRQARTLLGSHRLRVAMAIWFRNQYRCPYCNESTQMVARESRMAHRRQPTR